MKQNLSDLGLSEPILRATTALNYEFATPIQAQAIPVVLQGRDLMACAQTGTGKTAAFTLPMLERLQASLPPEQRHVPKPKKRNRWGGKRPARPWRPLRSLVLAPTRELADQISDSLSRYGRFTSLRHTVVYGGVSQFRQVRDLRDGVDTLVATPGRLLDLMGQGHIDLSQIEILVLDEADQMLDMGFLPALEQIIAAVPTNRQTLMLSATMPDEIRQLAQRWLNQPATIQIGPASTPVDKIKQSVHFVDRKRKSELLVQLLTEIPRSRTLVFSRTKAGADMIAKQLDKAGLRAVSIHGDKSQSARSRSLAQFKSKNPPILVATDVAARGLNVNDISHVVNFDMPDVPETYVHRIGRTARAGADGVAISFCAGDEHGLLRQIERLIKLAIQVEPTVEGFEPTEEVVFKSAKWRSKSGDQKPRPWRKGKPGKPSRHRPTSAKNGARRHRKGNKHRAPAGAA
ncbi:MAG: DEAD/DEAH box helicase [Pirellulaceae bacterium]|nr:DEAD/DEAH box helicase [Planctomycetales bacterium]